ncbi:MAG: recombinase family protein [Bacteroidales bacterium]|nr:recombinase family protein [Bacteroidales bacterium]
MNFGYARVSKKDQNLDLQIDALQRAGCEKIFEEKLSGRSIFLPNQEKLFEQLRKGDILIVNSIDRLGRTAKQLIDLFYDLKQKGVNFKSLTEGVIDTTTPMGEAVFQIMAILKGMEVSILIERTNQGLEAARARGRKGGRKPGSYNKVTAAAAATLYQKGDPVSDILTTLKISRATLYEYLRKEGVNYIGFRKAVS